MKNCPHLRHADMLIWSDMHLCVSVDAENLSALLHSVGELCKHVLGILPANASVSDADTILQAILALLWYFLVAYSTSDDCGLKRVGDTYPR